MCESPTCAAGKEKMQSQEVERKTHDEVRRSSSQTKFQLSSHTNSATFEGGREVIIVCLCVCVCGSYSKQEGGSWCKRS